MPPHNLEAEESVLGAMMLSSEAIADVVEVLQADDFYRSANGKIFDARGLYARGEPVDTVTAVEELKRAGILEESAVTCTSAISSSRSRPPLRRGTTRGSSRRRPCCGG